MSKSHSSKAENNIGLVAGGLIGLGCLTALGVGLITLPVAIGIGAVVAGGFGAKELMNMREEKKAIDPNQARYEKATQQGFKEVNQRRGPLNEEQVEEGKTIGREIAKEYITDPEIKIKDSLVIKKYQDFYDNEKSKSKDSQKTIDAKFKHRVAFVAKEIAKDFHEKKEFAHVLLRAYKSDQEFSKKIIAESAFDEVARVIKEHQQRPSPAPQSPISRRDNAKERG